MGFKTQYFIGCLILVARTMSLSFPLKLGLPSISYVVFIGPSINFLITNIIYFSIHNDYITKKILYNPLLTFIKWKKWNLTITRVLLMLHQLKRKIRQKSLSKSRLKNLFTRINQVTVNQLENLHPCAKRGATLVAIKTLKIWN